MSIVKRVIGVALLAGSIAGGIYHYGEQSVSYPAMTVDSPPTTTCIPSVCLAPEFATGTDLTAGAANQVPANAATSPSPNTTASPRSVYVLGDSLTNGMMHNVPKGADNLATSLNKNGWPSAVIEAACGRPLVGKGMFASCDKGRPQKSTGINQISKPADQDMIRKSDAVVVALGTNDSSKDPAIFKDTATQLIQQIRGLHKTARIIWVNTYFAPYSGKGNKYLAINKIIANLGVDVVDYAGGATPFYRQVCSDGTHPCPDGYGKMIEGIINKLNADEPLAALPIAPTPETTISTRPMPTTSTSSHP